MDSFYGEIRLFAGDFAPQGWAFCEGQLVSVKGNQALFSVLGTTYGGDGINTFALPNLNATVPVHQGQGPGLQQWEMGEERGEEQTVLAYKNLPGHTHSVRAYDAGGNSNQPTGNIFANRGKNDFDLTKTPPDKFMSPYTVTISGGTDPINHMQPYMALGYIISISGPIFPPRP